VAVNEYKQAQEKDKNGKRDKAGYEQVPVARLCFGSHGKLLGEAKQSYRKFGATRADNLKKKFCLLLEWPSAEASHPFARKKAKGWGTEHLWNVRRGRISKGISD
jgi:hypothetical protein